DRRPRVSPAREARRRQPQPEDPEDRARRRLLARRRRFLSKRPLALRLYGLTAAVSIAAMVALLVLPRFVGSPRYLESQAALVQYMVDRLSLRAPEKLEVSMNRIGPRLRGGLTLFDANGNLVRSTVDPPLPGATKRELATLKTEKWALAWRRIVVRSDD